MKTINKIFSVLLVIFLAVGTSVGQSLPNDTIYHCNGEVTEAPYSGFGTLYVRYFTPFNGNQDPQTQSTYNDLGEQLELSPTFDDTIYVGYESNGSIENLYAITDIVRCVPQDICVVIDDNNDGYNEVVFERYASTDYVLYRDGTPIDTVYLGEMSVFIDSTNSPFTSAVNYSIGEVFPVPSAGDEHTTIHLRTFGSTGPGEVNLEWDDYEGVDLTGLNYDIVRSNADTTYTLGTVPTSNGPEYNLTINGHTSGDTYQIQIAPPVTCNPSTGKTESLIKSNIYSPNTVNVDEVNELVQFMVNPSDGLNLTLTKNVDVLVHDMSGRQIKTYSNTTSINDVNFTSGVYLVTITDGTTFGTKRLIVQ